MQRPDGTDPRLEQLRGWKALLSLWEAGEHAEAVQALIQCMMRCSPGAKIRGPQFKDNGLLCYWNMAGCGLAALPEEFGTLRITGDLDLRENVLASLPESFSSLTPSRELQLAYSRWESGFVQEQVC
eukprot:TRINITY_DN4252_c0_g3_i1.p2 TRINITY_DN4252_c0_g3~~TRINITY_DN4252_c0_g3_i1.p2  ORF type:complete len:127 (-),score=20.60 TRINITY_DN4252_c0_g3_i1:160-540(-)